MFSKPQGYHFQTEVDVHVNKLLVIITTCICTVLHGLKSFSKYISLFDTIYSYKIIREGIIISYRRENISCNTSAIKKQVKSFLIYIPSLYLLPEVMIIKEIYLSVVCATVRHCCRTSVFKV